MLILNINKGKDVNFVDVNFVDFKHVNFVDLKHVNFVDFKLHRWCDMEIPPISTTTTKKPR